MSYTLLRPGRVLSQRVNRDHNARLVAARLVSASIEFHVEPLPDDTWDFTVHATNATIASQNFNCWQFFGSLADDKDHGLFCNLPVDHHSGHNGGQRATYGLAANFGR